jgi:hypothetical protein
VFSEINRKTYLSLPRGINVTDACRITEIAHCSNCAQSGSEKLVFSIAAFVLTTLVAMLQS